VIAPAAGWGRRPGRGTATVLLVAALFAGWLFTPTWAAERGIDAKDLYAAASLQSRGGNPYDPAQQGREQDRLFNVPSHILPGQGGYAHAPYGYPPLFTVLLRAALPLGFGGFYLAAVALLLAAGLGGFEAVLTVAGWRQRWLARGFFLASMPMALSLFVGNPSPLLLLGWAVALLLARRGRPFAGGLVLTLCMLKLPVGLPAAAALVIGIGSGRLLLATGLAVGSAVLGSLQLLLTGPDATINWIRSLSGFASALGSSSASGFSQSGLAGVPTLFFGFVPPPVAILIGLGLIAAILTWAHRRLSTPASGVVPELGLAVILVAAVGATPYLHLNDLVLLALPLVLLAQTPGGVLGRLTELAWFIGIPARLFALAIASVALNFHPTSGSAGIGVVLLLLLLVALPIAPTPRRPVDPGS
jgi:Glycosyltransferase family 87